MTEKYTLAQFPEWQESERKRREIEEEIAATAKEIDEHEQQLSVGAGGRVRDSLDQAALAVIEGSATDERPDLAPVRERLAKMRERLTVYERAKALHGHNMDKLRAELSRKIIDKAFPEYGKIVERMADAVVALSELNQEEETYRRALLDDGVMLGDLVPMPFPKVGLLRDEHSIANFWLREAHERGYLKKARAA
jgi:hypothetical protein